MPPRSRKRERRETDLIGDRRRRFGDLATRFLRDPLQPEPGAQDRALTLGEPRSRVASALAHLGRYPIGTTIKSGPAPKVDPAVRRAGRQLRFMRRQDDPPALTAQLDQHLCAIGQQVDFRTYPGVSHDGIPAASQRDVLAWVDARFAGEPAPSNCRRSR